MSFLLANIDHYKDFLRLHSDFHSYVTAHGNSVFLCTFPPALRGAPFAVQRNNAKGGDMARINTSLTYVLTHGAWHGAWCWQNVANLLRAHGHAVTTPTLKGLGERAYQLNKDISLNTFVTEIVDHILDHNLRDVTLVGHSFAGAVISGVADRIPDRLARLIFFDAVVLHKGESVMSMLPPAIQQERLAEAEARTSSVALPAPPATSFGLIEWKDLALVDSRLTPHPLKSYLSKLSIRNALGNGVPIDYIACTKPFYPFLETSMQRAAKAGWPIHTLDAGHDAMISAPEKTTFLLEAVARGDNPSGYTTNYADHAQTLQDHDKLAAIC